MKKKILSSLLLIVLLFNFFPALFVEAAENTQPEPVHDWQAEEAELVNELHASLAYNKSMEMQQSIQGDVSPASLFVPTYHDQEALMPSTGDVKMLVLPIEFQDFKMTQEEFDGLDSLYFAAYDSKKKWDEQSVSGGYYAVSHGKLNISGTVLPLYTAPENAIYYAENENGPVLTWGNAIVDAIQYYVDNGLNLSDYDGDDDGYLDALAVTFPMPGYQGDGFWGAYMWPITGTREIDGIKLKYYAEDRVDLPNAGTMIHEMGHLMGLPDHYFKDSSYIDQNAAEIMSAGRYFNAYYQYLLGWIEPKIMTNEDAVQGFDLYAIENMNPGITQAVVLVPDAFLFPFSEYYIIEYRRGNVLASDRNVTTFRDNPGVIIWHIDAYLSSTNSYQKKTSFIKPVYKSGDSSHNSYGAKDIYVEGDIFSSDSSPVNSDFYNDVYTGAYFEIDTTYMDRMTIKAGFRDPDLSPAPVVTISEPSKKAVKSGNVAFNITYTINDELLEDENINYSAIEYNVINQGGTVKYSYTSGYNRNPQERWFQNVSGDGILGITVKAGAAVNGLKRSRMVVSETVYVDNTIPEITLLGPNEQTIERGGIYKEQWAEITDNLDPDIEDKLVIDSSKVNTDKTGTYTVTYNATDHAGNMAEQVTRTVKVVDTIAPTVAVSYSTTEPTASDVTATLTFSEPVTITANGNKLTKVSDTVYSALFTANNEFTVEFKDLAGNTGASQLLKVENIDKSLPTGTISYSTDTLTNGNVTANLTVADGITVTNNGGSKEHIFTGNGSFDFAIKNSLGTASVVTATVNWIDKTAPTINVGYSKTTPTNQNVTATLTFSEPVTITANEDKLTQTENPLVYTALFTDNDEYTIEFKDFAENQGTAQKLKVSNIDRTAPTAQVIYSPDTLTNQDVTATITFSEPVTITAGNENLSKNTELEYNAYFPDNDSFVVEYEDIAGNPGQSLSLNVDWIDKTAPTINVEYSKTTPTNQNVTATLTFSEPVSITANEDKLTQTENPLVYTALFTDNDEYTIEFKDLAENVGTTQKLKVSNIDKVAPIATVSYSPNTQTTGEVTATITPSEPVTITNNSGSTSYTFTENGSFIFEFEDLAGNTGTATATVDWITKQSNPPPTGGTTSYLISFDYDGGIVTEASRTVEDGQAIGNLPLSTKENAIFSGWYTEKNGKGIKYTSNTIVVNNLTLYANWKGAIPASEKFHDIDKNKWYYDAVNYVYQNGLFTGVTETEFAPNSKMTRAMFVTVIGRMAEQMGESTKGYTNSFKDVKQNMWYSDYISWANAKGIVTGYSDTRFGTSDYVSRQDMAVIIIRFADYMKLELPEDKDKTFTDEKNISPYAREAVKRASKAGIINGYPNGSFNPKRTSTRAEVGFALQNPSVEISERF